MNNENVVVKKDNKGVIIILLIIIILGLVGFIVYDKVSDMKINKSSNNEIKENGVSNNNQVDETQTVTPVTLTAEEASNISDSDIISEYVLNAEEGSLSVDVKLYKNNVMDIVSGNGYMVLDDFRGTYQIINNELIITRMYYRYNHDGIIEYIDGGRELNNYSISKIDTFVMNFDKTIISNKNYLKGSVVYKDGVDVSLTKVK